MAERSENGGVDKGSDENPINFNRPSISKEIQPTKPIFERDYVASAPRFPAAIDSQIWAIFDDTKVTDSTPNVENIQYIRFQTTIPDFVITDFLNGQEGQHLCLLGDGNIKLDDPSAGRIIAVGTDTPISDSIITQLINEGGVWREQASDTSVLLSSLGSIVQQSIFETFNLVINVPQNITVATAFTTTNPKRWESPGLGGLQYIGKTDRLLITFVSLNITPTQNNREFTLDILLDDVVVVSVSLATGKSGISYTLNLSGVIVADASNSDIIKTRITSNSTTSVDISVLTIQSMDFFS